ncbi:MAG TPA: hypothetical protein VFU12_20640 [Glycomyces sp.]|nr:hypothetical protein [Glycomyces sp.]
MAGSVEIDPAVLEEVKTSLSAAGSEFAVIAEDLVATMEGLAEAYGSDEVGGLIMEIHQEILMAFQECLQDAGADIEDVAATLGDVGAITQEIDDVIASEFEHLLGQLGG